MLVISRKKNQTVRIGDATITILKTGRNVSIGIVAPKETPIVRGELEPKAKSA